MKGELPDALVGLSKLRLLDLGGNALSGSLPAAWGAVGAFPDMATVNLADNQLSGATTPPPPPGSRFFPPRPHTPPLPCEVSGAEIGQAPGSAAVMSCIVSAAGFRFPFLLPPFAPGSAAPALRPPLIMRRSHGMCAAVPLRTGVACGRAGAEP